ncbi:unnamed protein product [Didymodactylos carnosus]|uniref:Uncharacterized protein n=1 Tax=Didymodactylos carnosus TaxID=1234261 RepID=A0A814L885_9BILA|nr:unnamed protein product [Didymodactylos carnosus]CAF3829468.1 unnamed protein product [Didymodactylos carnosus]
MGRVVTGQQNHDRYRLVTGDRRTYADRTGPAFFKKFDHYKPIRPVPAQQSDQNRSNRPVDKSRPDRERAPGPITSLPMGIPRGFSSL